MLQEVTRDDIAENVKQYCKQRGYTVVTHLKNQGKKRVGFMVENGIHIRGTHSTHDDEAMLLLASTGPLNLALVSARAPPGLDKAAPESTEGRTALQLYSTLLEWHQRYSDSNTFIIAGDLNETRTDSDRKPLKRTGKKEAEYLGQFLMDSGMIDVGGREGTKLPTYESKDGGQASRIDYFLVEQETAPATRLFVQDNLLDKRDHKVLVLETAMTVCTPQTATPLDTRSAPRRWRLDRISEARKRRFTRLTARQLQTKLPCWKERTLSGDIEKVVSEFNEAVRACADDTLIKNKSKQKTGKQILSVVRTKFPRQMTAVTRLRKHILTVLAEKQNDAPVRCAKTVDLLRNVIKLGLMSSEALGWNLYQLKQWLDHECPGVIAKIREGRKKVAEAIAGPVHYDTLFNMDRKEMYNTLFRPTSSKDPLTSVEKDGKILTGEAALREVEESVAHTFGQAKSKPEEEKIEWVRQLYRRRDNPPNQFQSVMREPTIAEIKQAIERTPNGKTGYLGVSNDLLKLLIRDDESQSPTEEALRLMVSAVMREGKLPDSIKNIQMRMIPKAGNKKKDVNALRPISIIPELAKIISKILAQRIMDVLTKHPDILLASQRGFLRHGNIAQCIDVLIDALEDNKERQKKKKNRSYLHVASYDQSKAYDSVQMYTIQMSLERLNFPELFIKYVMSTLEGCSATVLSGLGKPRGVALRTGVKQGDPLAPLLFLFVVDPLHRGIESNPLYNGKHDGYVMLKGQEVADTAYADDFTVTAKDWAGLQRIHEWICEFMKFHNMRINADKSHFTCDETKARKKPKELKGSTASEAVHVLSPAQDWRHLGVQVSFDLSWKAQQQRMQSVINIFRAQCGKNKLNTLIRSTAAWEYLMPKLELGLKHAAIPQKVMEKWNAEIRYSILQTTTVRGAQTLSKAAFNVITNIPNIQLLQKLVRTAELHIRLNSEEPPSSTTAWARLMALSTTNAVETTVQYLNNKAKVRPTNSIDRAIKDMQDLNVSVQLNSGMLPEEKVIIRDESQQLRWSDWVSTHSDPYSKPGSLIRTEKPMGAMIAFTDGSTPLHGEGCSGVGIVLKRAEQKDIEIARPFKTSGNNYAAELMAILIAIKVTPVNSELTIYTDSKSAIQGLQRDLAHTSERQWLRTAARPLVRSIHKLLELRKGMPTRFEWVRAHTGADNPYAIANKRADELANLGRQRGEGLQLPEFTHNENKVIFRAGHFTSDEKKDPKTIHIPGDVRRELRRECVRQTLQDWLETKHHGELARVNPTDTLELCKTMRQYKSNKMYDFYLQALTQTADTHDRREHIHASDLHTMNSECLFCEASTESLRHIFTCQKVHKLFEKHIGEVIQGTDPSGKLKGQLTWFSTGSAPQALSRIWNEAFESYAKEDKESGIMDSLNTIEKHDRFAGILGIMPRGLHEVLTKLIIRTNTHETNRELALQRARQDAAAVINRTRRRLMRLSMDIWTAWKAKQRRLRQTSALCKPAEAPKTKPPATQTKRRVNSKKTSKSEPRVRKRHRHRDKDPRNWGVKKKFTKRFF